MLCFVAGTVQAAEPEPIKIGFTMALTGPLAVIGKSGLLAFRVAASTSPPRNDEDQDIRRK